MKASGQDCEKFLEVGVVSLATMVHHTSSHIHSSGITPYRKCLVLTFLSRLVF